MKSNRSKLIAGLVAASSIIPAIGVSTSAMEGGHAVIDEATRKLNEMCDKFAAKPQLIDSCTNIDIFNTLEEKVRHSMQDKATEEWSILKGQRYDKLLKNASKDEMLPRWVAKPYAIDGRNAGPHIDLYNKIMQNAEIQNLIYEIAENYCERLKISNVL